MEIFETKLPIYKFTVENHNSRKKELLDAIEQMGQHPRVYSVVPDSKERISNTDYEVNINRLYLPIVKELLEKPLLEFTEYIPFSNQKLEMTAGWIQQYKKGDEHGWHCHPDSNFSSVYYIELPKDTKTQFRLNDGEDFELDISEGDYIIFPSFLFHRSPPNMTDERKTIYSTNINLRSYK